MTKVTMTLGDLERLNVCTLSEINKIYGAHRKNFNEDRPILSAVKCRPMIVVSKNVRYMRGWWRQTTVKLSMTLIFMVFTDY